MMRPRGPTFGGPSKATPQTLCQKCLKRGHFSYECKGTAQDRPYVSRPSRTQQLANPKLIPKLTSDIANDLLRKKGVADEQLAKNAEERGRKRAADENASPDGPRKRSRSMKSSYSSTSVSTISTQRSRSASPLSAKVHRDGTFQNQQKRNPLSISFHNGVDRKRRRRSRSSSLSYSSDSSFEKKDRRRTDKLDRNTRRRRSSISPEMRGRDIVYASKRRPRSRSKGRDKSKAARNRNSMTPAARSDGDRAHVAEQYRNSRDQAAMRNRGQRYSNDNDRYGSSFRNQGQPTRDQRPRTRDEPSRQSSLFQRKERSLSPFSKRLALTQAMNMGR